MQNSNPDLSESGTYTFAIGRLLPLLEGFSEEIKGVRVNTDVEHVHHMRVASRRLRAALPLFATCFPKEDYRFWMHEIKKITRALGDARDTDVQIAFLKKYLKNLQNPEKTKGNVPVHPVSDPILNLQTRLQKRRSNLQRQVVSVLAEFEEGNVIAQIKSACTPENKPVRMGKRDRYSGILPVAVNRIGKNLERVYQFEPFVHNPDAVFEHHALRIAAKKLRYTMEIYAPIYRRNLKKPISRIKKLQDLLGDMHDCDVWIEHMSLAIIKQRARRHPTNEHHGETITSVISPLRRLLINREKRRAMLYRQFVHYWDSLKRTGFWAKLHTEILSGQRSALSIPKKATSKDESVMFEQISHQVPDHVPHSQSVQILASQLFDQLKPLLGLETRDRTLLSYAALIHDIGWNEGKTGHQRKGAELILSYPKLPISVREQGIIALVAGLHGGRAQVRPQGFFVLLPERDQKRVRTLAGILRVADGLDYLHAGHVTGLSCSIQNDVITCKLTAMGDVSTEKERAVRKSDLFFEVFNKPLVIA